MNKPKIVLALSVMLELALSITLATVGCHTAGAMEPSSRILYSSDQDDANPLPPILFPISPGKNFDLYVMSSDGGGRTRLTNSLGNDQFATWSPDGKRIAFESSRPGNGAFVDYDVYVMNADGSDAVRLARSVGFDTTPAWSPDGQRLSFTSFRYGDPEIYVMNADGTDQNRITFASGWDFAFGNWCHDGRIVFHSERDGEGAPIGLLPLRSFGVYVMNADGSGLTRLTYDTTVNDHQAVWSPDCSRIAFVSTRDHKGDLSCGPAGCGEIYVMNADGSEQTRLTDDMADARDPSWSPDGTAIAFDSNRDGDFEIYLIGADGSDLTQLTNNTAYDFHPVFEPSAAPPPPIPREQ